MTPARAAANRTRALKHGLYARVVSPKEVARVRLEQILPGSPAIIDAYVDAEVEATDAIAGKALAEKALLRQAMANAILERGVIESQPMIDKRGNKLGERVRANPGLKHLKWLDEQLGFTAEAMQISPVSSGKGQRVEAETRALERRARLVKFAAEHPERVKLLAPPPPADWHEEGEEDNEESQPHRLAGPVRQAL